MRLLALPAFKYRHTNPYQAMLYEAMQASGHEVVEFSWRGAVLDRYDILHVHWPEMFTQRDKALTAWSRTVAFLGIAALARLRRRRVVWTVHNLKSHEGRHPLLEALFWRLFPSLLTGAISLSESGRKKAEENLPRLRRCSHAVICHGHYRGQYPDTIDRAGARARLGLPNDAFVVSFVGLIRKYKNVPELIRTFRAGTSANDALLIAGEPAPPPAPPEEAAALAQELHAAAGGDARIRLHVGFVPADELQFFFRAADLVILPFRQILNSGSALLALSFDCPILVPAVGALPDLQALVGHDWVRTYEGALTPEILADAMAWARDTQRAPRAPLDLLDWSRLAQETTSAFERLG